MIQVDFRRNILPHLIVLGAFILIELVYFRPVIFEGKQLRQEDRLLVNGTSREIVETRDREGGEYPTWTTTIFSGMPSYLALNPPSNSVNPVFDALLRMGFPYPISIPLVGLISFYVLLLAWRVHPYLAGTGAIAFTFASFFFISLEVGHNSKLNAMAYSALLMAGVVFAMRKQYLWGLLLAAIGMGLHLFAGHYQITYYLLFIVVIYGINQLVIAVKEKEVPHFFKAVGVLTVGVLLGVMTNSTRLLTTLEYTAYSTRGGSELGSANTATQQRGLDRDYVFNWSNSPMEMFTLMVPNLYGGSSQEPVPKESVLYRSTKQFGYYWGEQPFTAGPVYVGAIICFLFVLGLMVLSNRMRVWLAVATLLGIALAMGRHFPAFNYFLYDYMPLFNKFRAVTMALYIPQFTMAIMAALTLQKVLVEDPPKDTLRKVYLAAGITGSIALIFYLFPSLAGSFIGPNDSRVLSSIQQVAQRQAIQDAIIDDRTAMLQADALRSLLFIMVSAGLLWLRLNGHLKTTLAMGLFAGLVLIDSAGIASRYLSEDDFERQVIDRTFQKTPADQVILQDSDLYYRVINLLNPFNDGITPYHHKTVGGYHPAKLQRYQELIERGLQPEIQQLITRLQSGDFSPEFMQNLHVHNMLRTKYFIAGKAANAVISNPYALDNAWFVQNVTYVEGPEAELAATTAPDFAPARTAIIDAKQFEVSKTTFDPAGARIDLVDYTPTTLDYQVNSPNGGLVVLSEIYYPEGWRILLDGQYLEPEKLLRANYVLRALEVPAGQHDLRLSFESQSYERGTWLAYTGSALLLLILAFVGFVKYREAAQAGPSDGSPRKEAPSDAASSAPPQNKPGKPAGKKPSARGKSSRKPPKR